MLLGFALGGFFDGILLHQILQWHHLLSALEGEPFTDLRFQVLADGVFHALMYLVAMAGLGLLWRVRRELAAPQAGRLLLANALIGFGLWHIVDAILSHWLLGIHRIRMDSPNPLLWDLIWFTAFGVLFVLAGWWLRRRPEIGSSEVSSGAYNAGTTGPGEITYHGHFSNDQSPLDVQALLFGALDETQDEDWDGVANDDDVCPGTELPEAAPTSGVLLPNHFALTGEGPGQTFASGGPGQTRESFTIFDTSGCSCEQIVGHLRLGGAHLRNGCSVGVMRNFIRQLP